MRTTLTIEDGLLEEAKRRAREQETSLREVVNEALRAGLLRPKASTQTDVEKPLITFRGGGVRPGIDLNDSVGLLEAMDEK